MIKKLIGLLAAAGILAVLVSTVLYCDGYRSMVFEEGTSLRDFFGGSKSDVGSAPEPAAAPVPDEADYTGEGFDAEEPAAEAAAE